ncbi:MAG: isochorismatase family protein [bacterium]
MKESYFTPENIQEISGDIIRKIFSYQRNIKSRFNPEKSALLILDMQNIFLNQKSHAFIPSAPAIVENISTLQAGYRSKQLPVIFTRHSNTEANAGMMKIWWKTLINPRLKESEIINSLDTADSNIIEKSQYDAFHQTELHIFLLDNNIEQLVITGVMTHLCCECTIRSAFVRGYTVFFPVDGTATYNLDFHTSSCINLSHGFAVCTLCEKLVRKL